MWSGYWFHTLPVEAYPDVASTYVNIIAQSPGHAGEVEQQVSIPGKTVVGDNGTAVDYDDVIEGIVLLRRGAQTDET